MNAALASVGLRLVVWVHLACAAPTPGAAPVGHVNGTVMDEEGRPVDDVAVEVCGEERKRPDGGWDRNHTPHCLMPRASIAPGGRFTVPLDQGDVRVNLWLHKDGFAPAFVPGLSPQAEPVKVTLTRGVQIAGQVSRLANGTLLPAQRVAVHLGCSSGDLAHQRLLFQDPWFSVMESQEGEDLPYLQTVFTGGFGEYVLRLSPPPPDKTWFVVCLGEVVRLDVHPGQPTQAPGFVVQVQVRDAARRGVQAADPAGSK